MTERDSFDVGSPGIVRVTRGGRLESVHRVHVAVAEPSGALVASVGDPDMETFYRSAAKPFQALPLVVDGAADALGLTEAEVALCCASHSGEAAHVEGARSILAKAGVGEDALACGPQVPKRREDAERLVRTGTEAGRIHNNCSGKHAGMLALAVHHGWPTEGYHRAEHPVQRRIAAEMARWTGIAEEQIGTAVDGCGVVCFAVPLRAMARSFARLAEAAAAGEDGPSRIVAAMTAHPWMVAGTGRSCTAVMEAAGDRVAVKTGAEGVYGGLIRNRGLGLALKVEDGAGRASQAALVRVLELLGVLDAAELEGPLADLRRPVVRNTRGEDVGLVDAAFTLAPPS